MATRLQLPVRTISSNQKIAGAVKFRSDALSKVLLIGGSARSTVCSYFFVSLVLIVFILLLTDRLLIPMMEDAGLVVAHSWHQENVKWFHMEFMRNHASAEIPVWHSDGWQVSVEKSKKKRILVLGDSFVFGRGLSNMNDIWWRQLQKELLRRGYRDVEVIAAGGNKGSTRDELEQAKVCVPVYKPDAIIMGYVTNDADEKYQHGGKIVKLIEKIDDGAILQSLRSILSSLLPNVTDLLFSVRDKCVLRSISGSPSGYEWSEWELKVLEGSNFEQYKKTVQDLGTFFKSTGVPSFVMTLPVAGTWTPFGSAEQAKQKFIPAMSEYYTQRYNKVEKLFRSNNIAFLNILSPFLNEVAVDPNVCQRGKFPLLANPADGHPGPFATHFYAVMAADYLESFFPHCLGPKTNEPETDPEVIINDWMPPNLGVRRIKSGTYWFAYPDSAQWRLFMPLRKEHVQLSLQSAMPISSLTLTGPCLRRANIFIGCEDAQLHYDDGKLHELGEKRGRFREWKLPKNLSQQLVSTIRVCADFNGPDTRLILHVEKAGPHLTASDQTAKR